MKLEDPDFLLINSFLKKRDHDAFKRLMEKYQDRVYNYCFRFLGNDWDASDCCQDIFIKTFRSLESFQFKAKFSSWLYRIMMNTCNEMIRSKSYRNSKKRKDINLSETDTGMNDLRGNSYASNPEYALYRKQVNEAFQQALNELNPIQRKLIILRDLEGHSYDEISKITGMKIGTIRSALSRARHRMAGQLKHFRHAM